ncbi:MAG: hypothetical protein AAGD92_05110 [Pseudomonadota bacterium]
MRNIVFAAVSIAFCSAGVAAQDIPSAEEKDEQSPSASEQSDESEIDAEPDPDESADSLNGAQQLKQTFTLTRTINGDVVETKKKTVTLAPGVPYRPTEAGESALQQVKSAFDKEVLTRVEAFEEAKLDFTIADVDRDNIMTSSEFVSLVQGWRETGAKDPDVSDESETARQRQYESLLAAINPDAAAAKTEEYAKKKFSFISGAAQTLSREDYIREYLLDFDTMDYNKDTILQGTELIQFRALNRGETLDL